MRNDFFICSNPDCDYSRRKVDDIWVEYCPFCASAIIDECPECQYPVAEKNAIFCVKCKARLKPEPTPKDTPKP